VNVIYSVSLQEGVAVCNVLWCVAMCCGVLHCVAVYCSVLQCVAVCCSVLQCSNFKDVPVVNLKSTEGICEHESLSLT